MTTRLLLLSIVCALGVQANNHVYDDLAINEATNVTVTSGTLVWHGNLTGAGTITKEGAGTLQIISTNNNFTGDWEIKAGTLLTGSAINKSAKFLGSGKVTVYASTEYASCIKIQTSVLPNTVEVIGNSSVDYPALQAVNQASYGAPITANGDLYIYQTGYSSGSQPFNNKLIFEKTGCINAPGQKVSMRPDAQFHFSSSDNYIVCDTLETTSSGKKGAGSVKLGSNQSRINRIRTDKARIMVSTSNVFGGAALEWYGQDTAEGYTCYILGNCDQQTVAYLTSDEILASVETCCYSVSNNPAGKVSTLVLTGGVDVATAYCQFVGKVALSVNSSDGQAFKQRLLNRCHTMTEPITVNANATLALGGGTTFANVTQVNVNGGTLEIEDGTPFANYTVNFALTNGGKIKLAAGVELRPKTITVDGTEVAGTFRQDTANTMVTGEGTLVALGSEPVTLLWTATEDTADVTCTTSWQGKPVFDLNLPDKYIARFAATGAGKQANVSGSVNFAGIAFTAAEGFTVANASPAATINLGSKGMIAEAVTGDNPETRYYTVEVPVTAIAAQHWTPGSATVTTFTNFTVDADVIMTNGHGTVVFTGTTTLNAALKNDRKKDIKNTDKTSDDVGRTMLFTGRVEGDGLLYNYGWNGAQIVLSNAVVTCPIGWYGDGSHSWAYWWFQCPPNTTNLVTGTFTASAATYFKIDSGARLTFSGGGTFGNKLSLNVANGTLVFTNKSIISSSSRNDNNAFLSAVGAKSRFILASPSNEFSRVIAEGENAVFEFGVDDVTSDTCVKEFLINCIDLDASNNKGCIEFNGTRQRFRFMRNNKVGKTTTLHGVYPATLGVYMNSTNATPITGWLTLVKLADDTIGGNDQELVLGKRAYESYGDITVQGGTLAFTAGGTWLNGTNVTVCGTGLLKLPNGGVFNSQHAILHVEETGKIDIPAGQYQAFREAYVNGVKVRAGTYTAAQPGAFAEHFATGAEGGIVVRRLSTSIIIR